MCRFAFPSPPVSRAFPPSLRRFARHSFVFFSAPSKRCGGKINAIQSDALTRENPNASHETLETRLRKFPLPVLMAADGDSVISDAVLGLITHYRARALLARPGTRKTIGREWGKQRKKHSSEEFKALALFSHLTSLNLNGLPYFFIDSATRMIWEMQPERNYSQ